MRWLKMILLHLDLQLGVWVLLMQESHEELSGVAKPRRELGDRDLGDTLRPETLQLHVGIGSHREALVVEGVMRN
jgi:hypothetical protein